jgi:hypothetical protein
MAMSNELQDKLLQMKENGICQLTLRFTNKDARDLYFAQHIAPHTKPSQILGCVSALHNCRHARVWLTNCEIRIDHTELLNHRATNKEAVA